LINSTTSRSSIITAKSSIGDLEVIAILIKNRTTCTISTISNIQRKISIRDTNIIAIVVGSSLLVMVR
jgi:hypothetical protein